MKIGILTYHRAHNYGALLQAYGLFNFLNKRGHDVEFIDYWPEYRHGEYDLYNYKFYLNSNYSILHRCKTFVYRSFSIIERYIRYSKFEDFINSNLPVSSIQHKVGNTIPNEYDLVICGSDQIWAYHKFHKKKGFDLVYFGKYPISDTVRKITYAASMGIEDMDSNMTDEFASALTNLSEISVREKSLLELVEPYHAAKQVLDPVFLLPKQDWQHLVKSRDNTNKYLLFYQLLESEEASTLAKQIAKDKGLEIVEIRGLITPGLWIKGIECTTGPIDFLSLIANANYVISTSFHGVAFSIVFQKQFTAMGFKKNGSRVRSLLTALGIDRCMRENSLDVYHDDIDYEEVDKKLKPMINQSHSYLVNNLSNNTSKQVNV